MVARTLARLVLVTLPMGCSPILYVLLHREHSGASQLVVGQPVQGSTSGSSDATTLTCGSPQGAGDESWTFVPPASGPYEVQVDGQYDCAVGVFGPDDDSREIGCNDDTGGRTTSRVTVALEAGRRYRVVVDGYQAEEGDYRLTIVPGVTGAAVAVPSGPPAPVIAPSPVPEDPNVMLPRCESAPSLSFGTVHGTLDLRTATARTSCGSGVGGDVVYRVVLAGPMRLTIKLEAEFDGILELRGGCAGPALACNDDSGDALHSQIATTLQAGTYFVVVDSYQQNAGGAFTLELTQTP